jgi:hypothetical protein
MSSNATSCPRNLYRADLALFVVTQLVREASVLWIADLFKRSGRVELAVRERL